MAHRYKPAHRSLPAYMGSHKFALPKPPAAGPPPSRGSDTRPAGSCAAGTPFTHAGPCGCKSWMLGCRSSALLQRCWRELCQTGSSPAGSPDRPGPSASCLCTAVCMPEAQGLHEHPSCCIWQQLPHAEATLSAIVASAAPDSAICLVQLLHRTLRKRARAPTWPARPAPPQRPRPRAPPTAWPPRAPRAA